MLDDHNEEDVQHHQVDDRDVSHVNDDEYEVDDDDRDNTLTETG